MRNPNKRIPDWAPQDRSRWPAGCSAQADGWYRWYKGRSRFVCAKGTPLADVEDRWIAKKLKINSAEQGDPVSKSPGGLLYHESLGEFLENLLARVGADRNRIEERTYHNYSSDLNNFGAFVVKGRKIADTELRHIGPQHFTAYASKFKSWKASGFDSMVCNIGAFFRWAVEMEYIDRFRPGPHFRRPKREEIRSQRIELSKSFTTEEVAKAYLAANATLRCWIALGVCAAFVNSDIAHFDHEVYDPESGVIDFRRRKTGKLRRIVPLPADVRDLLAAYRRPDPAERSFVGRFFLTQEGNPYTRNVNSKGKFMPANTVSKLTARLLDDAGVERKAGRNFSGFRTTHFNLAPRDKWALERKIVMGRVPVVASLVGVTRVDLDHYLEHVGMDELRAYVEHIWSQVRVEIARLSTSPAGAASPC